MIRTAMIMAAGRGTRMGALTEATPKPLLHAGGRALIDHALDRAAEGGAVRAVVNVHHHADQMRARLAARTGPPEIAISGEEDRLLETGGGLVRARPLLGPDPVFVLNSDAVFAGPAPLPALRAAWDPARMGALLLLVARADALAYTRAGDFLLDGDRPVRRGDRATAPWVYAGVQILDPAALDGFAEEAFSTNLVWDRLLAEGRLFAAIHRGPWVDVGTPAGLAEADALLARERA